MERDDAHSSAARARAREQAIVHCLEKVTALVATPAPDRRAVLQLGYNLGRLSELTEGGRDEFWDRWKTPVADWDPSDLIALAAELVDRHGGVGRPQPTTDHQRAEEALGNP